MLKIKNRTTYCGELSIKNINEIVKLVGWVSRVRDKGALIWIDLRDRTGIVQLVIRNEEKNHELLKTVGKIGREFVVEVAGIVIERESKNSKLQTGSIEIEIDSLNIINESKVPPFLIEDKTDGGSELRAKYRYLDLRRPCLQNNLLFKHQLCQFARNFLSENGFIELETPTLVKSTPEGARDYIVPSRLHEGMHYSLPQSPQLLKQLLMISGFDRYFQIAKCFRDEDLRSDRQPEFLQVDCEISFADQNEIINFFSHFVKDIFKKFKNIEIKNIQEYSYDYVFENYGSDKPDLRFDLKFQNISNFFFSKNEIFNSKIDIASAITLKNSAEISRNKLDRYFNSIKDFTKNKSKTFFIKKDKDGEIKSSLNKFLSEEEQLKISEELSLEKESLAIIACGPKEITLSALGNLRNLLANDLNLIDQSKFSILWVKDFPLFEWNDEENRLVAKHHPFTRAKENLEIVEKNPLIAKAHAYDLVINGHEIMGGSLRLYKRADQEKMLNILGFDEKKAYESFGFLLDALDYGTPPHGGVAIGLDRLCAVLLNENSIREFIPFPKNNSGRDVMLDAPNFIL